VAAAAEGAGSCTAHSALSYLARLLADAWPSYRPCMHAEARPSTPTATAAAATATAALAPRGEDNVGEPVQLPSTFHLLLTTHAWLPGSRGAHLFS
jgi:hypothetical protein